MSILCVFRKFSLQVTTLLVCTGAPSLHQTQLYVKRLKVLAGGYPVQNVLEFKQLCIPLLMPPNVSDLVVAADGGVVTTTPSRMFVIPLQASDFSVSGECFTGPQQIKWIGQLGKMPFKFVLWDFYLLYLREAHLILPGGVAPAHLPSGTPQPTP